MSKTKIRVLSGNEVVKIFQKFGFVIVRQRGSHIKLGRVSQGGDKQTLTIPQHDELDKGTIKAIYNQALRYIPENDFREHFYSK